MKEELEKYLIDYFKHVRFESRKNTINTMEINIASFLRGAGYVVEIRKMVYYNNSNSRSCHSYVNVAAMVNEKPVAIFIDYQSTYHKQIDKMKAILAQFGAETLWVKWSNRKDRVVNIEIDTITDDYVYVEKIVEPKEKKEIGPRNYAPTPWVRSPMF